MYRWGCKQTGFLVLLSALQGRRVREREREREREVTGKRGVFRILTVLVLDTGALCLFKSKLLAHEHASSN